MDDWILHSRARHFRAIFCAILVTVQNAVPRNLMSSELSRHQEARWLLCV